jgi:hypothetical protein
MTIGLWLCIITPCERQTRWFHPASANQHPWLSGDLEPCTICPLRWVLPRTICPLWWVLVHFGCFIIPFIDTVHLMYIRRQQDTWYNWGDLVQWGRTYHISETVPTTGYGALQGSPQGASLDSRQLLWWTGLTQLPLGVSRVGVLDIVWRPSSKDPISSYNCYKDPISSYYVPKFVPLPLA